MQPQVQTVQIQNRIGNQLARAVVGDVAATIRIGNGDACGSKPIWIGKQMITSSWATRHRDDRRIMLHQQKVPDRSVRAPTVNHLGQSLPLQRQGVLIGKASKVRNLDGIRG